MPVRALLSLAVLLLPASAVSAADTATPPAAAKAWLGAWKTNEGTFRFTSITGCFSGPQYVSPGCSVVGTWDESPAAKDFHGTIFLGPKYQGEVFQGCFKLPDRTDDCSFNTGGEISLDRAGDRITEGYWKACGLGSNCTSHHPIRGTKLADGGGATQGKEQIVRWSAVIDGFPDNPGEKHLPEDLAGVEIATHNTRLVRAGPGEPLTATGRLEMTLTYVSAVENPHVHEYQATVHLGGKAQYIDEPDRRKVIVEGEVVASDVPDCMKNEQVEIRLTIARAKRVLALDGLRGRPGECLSNRTVVWGPHRVKRAHISAETPG